MTLPNRDRSSENILDRGVKLSRRYFGMSGRYESRRLNTPVERTQRHRTRRALLVVADHDDARRQPQQEQAADVGLARLVDDDDVERILFGRNRSQHLLQRHHPRRYRTLRDLHGFTRRGPIALRVPAGALADAHDVVAVRMQRLDLLGGRAVEARAPRLLRSELRGEPRDVLLDFVEVAIELSVVAVLVVVPHPLFGATPRPRSLDVGESGRPFR